MAIAGFWMRKKLGWVRS